jgi:hypothetical protein
MLRLALMALILALPPISAHAVPLLSQTVYICSGICTPPSTLGGPAPIDPSALTGDTESVALAPGSMVGGSVSLPGLIATSSATASTSSLPARPPTFRLLVADTDLAVEGAAISHVYWEDDVTITMSSVPLGNALTLIPVVRVTGALDLFAGSGLGAGGTQWNMGMSLSGSAFVGSAGSCNAGFTSGPQPCTPGGGFFTNTAGTQFLNGVPFNLKGGVLAVVQGSNITGQVDLTTTVEFLGVTVLDPGGNPTTAFTLTSASGIDWTLASVPEPSITLLLAAGLLALARWQGSAATRT